MKLLPMKPAPPVTSTLTIVVYSLLSVWSAAQGTEDVGHVADPGQRHGDVEALVVRHEGVGPEPPEIEALPFGGEPAALRIVIARDALLKHLAAPEVHVEGMHQAEPVLLETNRRVRAEVVAERGLHVMPQLIGVKVCLAPAGQQRQPRAVPASWRANRRELQPAGIERRPERRADFLLRGRAHRHRDR